MRTTVVLLVLIFTATPSSADMAAAWSALRAEGCRLDSSCGCTRHRGSSGLQTRSERRGAGPLDLL